MSRIRSITDSQDSGVSGANQEDAESTFIPLGQPVAAVVMKLRTRLPRLKVSKEGRTAPREENKSRPL